MAPRSKTGMHMMPNGKMMKNSDMKKGMGKRTPMLKKARRGK